MYDLIDRPLRTLDAGNRFLVGAMRHWVVSMTAGECPPATLAPRFAAVGMMPALGHFHVAMALLNRDARMIFHFGPPRCGCVTDDEAVLLQLYRTIQAGDSRAARETLYLLVSREAVPNLLSAATQVALGLTSAGLAQAHRDD